MTDNAAGDLKTIEPFLVQLRALPFVQDAAVDRTREGKGRGARFGGLLRIRTPTRTYRLNLEWKRTNLAYTIADGVIAQAKRNADRPWMLFAPYIPRPMGEYLAAEGINYVDEVGNCRLELGEEHVAFIAGHKRRRPDRGATIAGPAVVEVMFAFLADAGLANAPVREIANRVGAGKTAVAEAIRQLARQGLITKEKPRRVLRRQELLDRWLIGYETIVRPKLLVGHYKTPEADPPALERRIEELLAEVNIDWGWAGGAAAMKLTGYYRGAHTVLVMEQVPEDFFRELRALRAEEGDLTVLETQGDLVFEGIEPHTVHPLIAFAELRISGDERAREAADELYQRFLEEPE